MCVRVCVSHSDGFFPGTGDCKLSCTSLCEHEKVMVFCHSLSGLTCVLLSGPLRCFLFPRCLLWTDWSWQALTFRNVPINGIHGCWYAVCWYMKSSAAAVQHWHINIKAVIIGQLQYIVIVMENNTYCRRTLVPFLFRMCGIHLYYELLSPQICLRGLVSLHYTHGTRLFC